MYGNIQNISGALHPRELEQSDTRLGLRSYEQRKRKGKQRSDQKTPSRQEQDSEDFPLTRLSVMSLILFLQDILEQRLDMGTKSNEERWTPHEPANVNMYKAASSAYRHAAEVSRYKLKAAQEPPHDSSFTSSALSDIYRLLEELRGLERRGIHTLEVQQDIPFLQSINEAITPYT